MTSVNANIIPKPKDAWPLRVLRRTVYVVIMAMVIVITLLSTISSNQPLITLSKPLTGNEAAAANRLMRTIIKDIARAEHHLVATTITENAANTIVAFAQRTISDVVAFAGQVEINNGKLTLNATARIPENPLGRYINLTLTLIAEDRKLIFDTLSVGEISLRGQWLIASARWLVNQTLDKKLGDQLFAAVHHVDILPGAIQINYGPLGDLVNQAGGLRTRAFAMRDQFQLLSDPDSVHDYFAHICDQGKAAPDAQLGDYLAWAFSYARYRTELSQKPATENKLALLSLSILLGSDLFETLIGDVAQSRKDCRPVGDAVTVLGRKDLRQHFIVSAAVQLITNTATSFAIGELKELADAGKGGSGFSFADLAADRAGLKFTDMALDPKSAERIQQHAQALRDPAFFFPDINDLPEGLSAAQFVQNYGNLDSSLYSTARANIDARIAQLPLYSLKKGPKTL